MVHLIWRRARRPEEIVEATRWVFAMLVLVTLIFVLPGILAIRHNVMLPVGAVASVVLVLSWSTGYLRRSAPLWLDVVDAVAFLGLALALPDPTAAVGVVMPALWFRSLYGSARRAVLRASFYAIAISASLPLWAHVPGRTGGAQVAVLVGVVPAMFLTVIASRQLAGGLAARTQAARRDAVHMSVGSALLGVTDAAEIDRIAWTAMSGICAATPGLRVVKVVRDDAVLRVDGAAGGFAGVPATLPATLLSVAAGHAGAEGQTVVHSHPELDAAAGRTCDWAYASADRVFWVVDLCLPACRKRPARVRMAAPRLAPDGAPGGDRRGPDTGRPGDAGAAERAGAREPDSSCRGGHSHRSGKPRVVPQRAVGRPGRHVPGEHHSPVRRPG